MHPRRVLDLLREERRVRCAAKRMPKPLPWDWARPRLIPLLAGPYLGPDLVTVVAKPGCAINFGVEISGTYVLVDAPTAERWEASEAQLGAVSEMNLDRRAAQVQRESVIRGTLAGRIVRLLDSVPWATSLVLSPDNLRRLFGSHDQVFGTPKRGTLMSFSIDTPTNVIAHLVIEHEANAAWPLMLDPFLLVDGELLWQDVGDDEWSSDA
jgi:hypothetical protein